ncbi:putative proton-dependent oligopeptide transporter family [Helianthus annuus]|nr:putative proton-dependent oligopeptide transporter family [Helianthus annuus]KAJ0499306.1 putative proton-dependent oligopeptide transporter family, MFS transporter superfamily [Helianthus annuus]KAJ0665326.1 putative proton-dependent oligopeptide transporter family, MFS transporter superfamily [Helianthus annuus]KAJ0860089.1 putative proton-dependent oligopeptide transporter family [Helianthus annuus]
MGLLSISTPSWLYSRITGACSEYTIKCIDEKQQILFYLGLMLIMIGKSAKEATMEAVHFKCLVTSSDTKVTIIFGLLFSIVESWSIRFGISAVFSFMTVYLLMGKAWSHKLDINKLEKSPVTTVLRVCVASFLKTFKGIQYDSTGIYKDIERNDHQLSHSSSIRLSKNSDKYGHNTLIHCSHQEVEDTKTLVRLLPVGVVLVFLGLISSMGNTYFVKQGDRLNPSIIIWKYVGVSQLFSIYEYSKNQFGKYTRKDFETLFKHPPRQQLLYAMIYAIPCCMAAAIVESSRLNVISKLGLENKQENIIPMRTFWLIPQFFILGIVDGSMERSIDMFFVQEMPLSMRNYGILVLKGFVGLGTIGSVLFVYVIGKISEMGGRPSWFHHNMENSRLDLFYWLLMVLCVVLLVAWIVLSQCVILAWNKQRPLNYKEDENDRLLEPGSDLDSIEDGKIGDQMVEAVIIEYLTKWRNTIKPIE